MTPIRDIIAPILARVLRERARREAQRAADAMPVADDAELARMADAWGEPGE